MSSKLDNVQLKLERAKHHVSDLQRTLAAFQATRPHKVVHKRDPDTGILIYYISHFDPIPDNVGLIAADAFGGFVSTLDHLIYQLFLANGGVRGKGDTHLYFPIFSDHKKFEAGLTGKVQGLSAVAITAIDAMEPYQGGAGHQFWVLKELNNLCKHRELMTVGIGTAGGFDLLGMGIPVLQKLMGGPIRFPDGAKFMAGHWLPIKFRRVGDVLVSDDSFPLDVEPNQNVDFGFDIAIDEPQIPNPEPIIETLHGFANLVEMTIFKLGPFL